MSQGTTTSIRDSLKESTDLVARNPPPPTHQDPARRTYRDCDDDWKSMTLRVPPPLLVLFVLVVPVGALVPWRVPVACAFRPTSRVLPPPPRHRHPPLFNVYDDWRADVVVDRMHLDEANVVRCLDEFVHSRYGEEMFGTHARAASVGITGTVEFVELCGPEVTLRLDGAFWHRRETVLGRAATWLNARMPEITDAVVPHMDDLSDFEEVRDEASGEVLFRRDKRSADFNGDRETMEYQGIDPDMRGPFPRGPMDAGGGASMINPM